MGDIAAGLGSLAFWLFIAAVVVGGMWSESRKRESQQETLRRLVESGQTIDKKVVDQILAAGGNKDLARDLKVGGLIMLFIAPGLAAMGWFMARVVPDLFPILFGVSLLVGFIAAGLLYASKITGRGQQGE